MLKIGLMGCGTVADYGHLPAIKKASNLQLSAIFDPNAENLARAGKKFGVDAMFSDAEGFMNSGIESVSITSPAPCHLENVLDAARRGFPVLCEKPLAMNDAEARQMIDAMKSAGQPLYVAFCYRFSPVALKIRELLQAHAIGRPLSLRLIYNWHCHGKYTSGPDGKPVIQKRREGRMFEGGPMVDCGTHQIDLAMWWLGSPVTHFQGHGAWVDEYEAPDHVWLHMDHACGAHTMVEMSYSYCHTASRPRYEFVYEIIGTDGVIRFDRENRQFVVIGRQGTQELECGPEKGFDTMYVAFADAVEKGESDLMATAETGMEVIRIARGATDQAIAGRARLGH